MFDAGGFELAGALRMVFVTGGADAVAEGAVGWFEGVADGDGGALEGFDCDFVSLWGLWR